MAAPVFVDGVTPLNAANFNTLGAEVDGKVPLAQRAAANGVATLDANSRVPTAQRGTSYGTTPPASPVDGDIWVLPADAAAGVMWVLRYNAASASTYKWEFVGGGVLYAMVQTTESTAVNSQWVNLTTDGPSITVPRAGDYYVQVGAQIASTIAAAAHSAGAAVGDTSPALPILTVTAVGTLNAQPGTGFTQVVLNVASAGSVIKVRYYVTQGTGYFQGRSLTVRPIRVI
jgi:hypothetical protein